MEDAIQFMQQVCADFANTLPVSARAAFINEANRHLQEMVIAKKDIERNGKADT